MGLLNQSLAALASTQTSHSQSQYGHSQSELVTFWTQRSSIVFVTCYIKYMPSKRPAKPATKRGRPPTGLALTAAQRMRHSRERRKAAGFRAVTRWEAKEGARIPHYSSHRLAEARSLALHVAIARKIDRDPTLLEVPKRNLVRWRTRTDAPPDWIGEWQALLKRPWPEIAALITELSERAARLRQSSPFPGVLTEAERERIYEAFRA